MKILDTFVLHIQQDTIAIILSMAIHFDVILPHLRAVLRRRHRYPHQTHPH